MADLQSDKPRDSDVNVGGSFWVKHRNLVQINAHISPSLHEFVLKLSEGTNMPISLIVSQCLEALRHQTLQKKILGVHENQSEDSD